MKTFERVIDMIFKIAIIIIAVFYLQNLVSSNNSNRGRYVSINQMNRRILDTQTGNVYYVTKDTTIMTKTFK